MVKQWLIVTMTNGLFGLALMYVINLICIVQVGRVAKPMVGSLSHEIFIVPSWHYNTICLKLTVTHFLPVTRCVHINHMVLVCGYIVGTVGYVHLLHYDNLLFELMPRPDLGPFMVSVSVYCVIGLNQCLCCKSLEQKGRNCVCVCVCVCVLCIYRFIPMLHDTLLTTYLLSILIANVHKPSRELKLIWSNVYKFLPPFEKDNKGYNSNLASIKTDPGGIQQR